MTNTPNLCGLLEKSYNLYKDNFSYFIQLSITMSLIQVISSSLARLLGQEFSIVYLLIALVLIYFQLRLSITFVYLIIDRYQNVNLTIAEYYKKSKEKIWQYIGSNIMLGLIVGIPLVLFYSFFLLSDDTTIKLLTILVGGSVVLFLFMHYFLAPFIVLLDPDSKTAFSESFRLVKSLRIATIYVMLILVILEGIPYLIFKSLELSGIIGTTIEAVIDALTIPLTLGFTIIYYIFLDKKYKESLQE